MKSALARASSHACWPSADARVISAARSAGTRTAFSTSRRVTARSRASADSGSRSATHGSRASSRSASPGSVSRPWTMRSSVAACSARAGAAAGGIIVFWSQNSSDPIEPRSESSASRSRREIRAVGSVVALIERRRLVGAGQRSQPPAVVRTTSPSRSRPASTRSRRSPSSPSGNGRPATSAATTRPRAQRSVASKRSRRAGRGGAAGAPGAAQPARTGQAPHTGRRGRHTVAPSSIIAWLNVAARPGGSRPAARAASARGVRRTPSWRSSTRRTLVSTAATGASHANEATAAAVYGPTPGRSSRRSGQPARATCRAAACSASARRL